MISFLQTQEPVRRLTEFYPRVPVDIGSTMIFAGFPGVARRQPTFFASPKNVGKERRPEGRRRCAVPSVARNDRPLRNAVSYELSRLRLNSCSPSDSPRGRLLSFLRYSATLIGAPSQSDSRRIVFFVSPE